MVRPRVGRVAEGMLCSSKQSADRRSVCCGEVVQMMLFRDFGIINKQQVEVDSRKISLQIINFFYLFSKPKCLPPPAVFPNLSSVFRKVSLIRQCVSYRVVKKMKSIHVLCRSIIHTEGFQQIELSVESKPQGPHKNLAWKTKGKPPKT